MTESEGGSVYKGGSVDQGSGVDDGGIVSRGGVVSRGVVDRGVVTDDALRRHGAVVKRQQTGVGGGQHGAKGDHLVIKKK